jgi:hypothetical protein
MLAILAALSASMALAEDFATINGKEYENATVTRVEADGIVIRTKGDTRVAAADFDFSITNLVIAILVIVIPLVPMIAIVPGVLAQRRREQRALLFKQARDWAATVQQNHALPTVPTNIMLKPGETAFYSSPSALYETRAVRQYQAGHSGHSVSTQEWAKLDIGTLTITNKRLVFDGGNQDRTVPLNKVFSVDTSPTEIIVSAEGRQESMAFQVANPLIASSIVKLCCQVSDPLNLSGDNININIQRIESRQGADGRVTIDYAHNDKILGSNR